MRKAIMPALAIVVTLTCSGGCGPTKVTTVTSSAAQARQVQTLIVVPFARLATPQVLDSAELGFTVPRGVKRSEIDIAIPPASIEAAARETTTVPPFAPEKVTDVMYRKLQARKGLRVLPASEAIHAQKTLKRGDSELTEQDAKDIAMKTGADAALIGRVLIYREREGSRWGAEPAVVGFEVKLVGSDGQTLWTGNYYEKQRPLIEDFVGFWQHGGGFATAEELAEYGAERLAREFPYGTK
jgi:hypothetical protein